MKKASMLILFATLLIVMCACTETKLEMLSDPQNIQVEKRVITWDPVENASGYLVTFDGIEYHVESNQLDVHHYLEEGTYFFTLIALGDGERYANSVLVQERIALGSVLRHGFDEKGFEYTFLEDALGYEVDKGTADLSGTVVVPDYFGDYPVKRLADEMFRAEGAYTHYTKHPDCFTEQYCNKVTTGIQLPAYLESIGKNAIAFVLYLEEIKIPDTVFEIESAAFWGCVRLKKVVLPQNLKEIPAKCFQHTALSEIILPSSLEVIGNDAFSTPEERGTSEPGGHVDSSLAEIVIPASVKSIGMRAFEGRKNLKSVILEGNVEEIKGSCFRDTAWFASQPDGLVYVKDFLYCYKGEMPENAIIEIPPGTKGICPAAFAGQKNLREVVMPEGIEFWHQGIFSQCSSLTSVSLPADMKSIPNSMFGECTNLKSVILPEGLTHIGTSAFVSSGLESITIPTSVVSIGGYAFGYCEALKEIILPVGVEIVAHNFIEGCNALETLFIPASVKEIDGYPFWGCDALTHIFYEGDAISELKAAIKNLDFETLPMLEAAPIYYYSEEKPTEEGLYWHYVDGKPTPWESEE